MEGKTVVMIMIESLIKTESLAGLRSDVSAGSEEVVK